MKRLTPITSIPKVKPMYLWESLLYFGGGCLLFVFMEHIIAPILIEKGVHLSFIFIVLESPLIIFFFVALLAFRKEGHEWSGFRDRFRIKPIRGKFWLWVIMFVLIDIGLYLAVYQFAYPLVKWVHDLFPQAESIRQVLGDENSFAGMELAGNPWPLLVYLFIFFFNIMGEELLWRGYIFPRQELAFGKQTWIVHGLLWTGFHLFAPYNALLVLPGALFMSYIVQRYQNTSIFIIAHATLNGLAGIRIIMGILG